jgi:hypothetical protein
MYADLNHLCNVWMFYVGIKGVESDWRMSGHQNTAFYMILYRTEEQDWNYLLKSWYFKQASATIKPGAIVRRASTNLLQTNPEKYDLKTDSTMVYAYGRKAPLYLASAVNTDGSWGIGLTNFTGDIIDTPLTMAFPPVSFRLTVTIEELADSGDIGFTLHRCNATAPYIHNEGTVLMHDGMVSIDSIGPFDMITLLSPPGTMMVDTKYSSPGKAYPAGSIQLHVNQTAIRGSLSIDFNIPDSHHPVSLAAYDCRGRLISEIFNGFLDGGHHRMLWSGKTASSFVILRLKAGALQDQVKTIITE